MTILLFLCNILKKTRVIRLIFCLGMVKHSQSFHNSKFAVSLQHLKKDFRDEVDLLQADKHQSLLQFDFKTFGIKVSYRVVLLLLTGMIKHSQSTQCNKLVICLQYLKKELRVGVLYCIQINIKISLRRH